VALAFKNTYILSDYLSYTPTLLHQKIRLFLKCEHIYATIRVNTDHGKVNTSK